MGGDRGERQAFGGGETIGGQRGSPGKGNSAEQPRQLKKTGKREGFAQRKDGRGPALWLGGPINRREFRRGQGKGNEQTKAALAVRRKRPEKKVDSETIE